MNITLPYNFVPRAYQVPLLAAMDRGIRHAMIIWHRKAGKDFVCLAYMIRRMYEEPGVYYHLFPTFNQGRKVIWDDKTNAGGKYTDCFPQNLVLHRNETEMQIEMQTRESGKTSIYQIIGTDDFDKIVGPNPRGLIFSEYMLQDPRARAKLLPILAANKGWEILNFTPRGPNNHATELYQNVKERAEWFTEVLDKDDTTNDAGEPIVSQEDIDDFLGTKSMTEEEVQQEFYCSFIGTLEGRIYSNELARAQLEGRIGLFPYEPVLDVETWWDLGRFDANSVWFVQRHQREVRFIDFHQKRLTGLPYFVKYLRDWALARNANYSGHYAGWDFEVHEYSTNQTRVRAAMDLGLRPMVQTAKKQNQEEGIDAVRREFPTFYFNTANPNVAEGVAALQRYERPWNAELQVYGKPTHNEASNPADALRNGVMASRTPRVSQKPIEVETEFEIFA